MNTYLTLFIISLCSSLFLTPVLRRLAQRFNWLDVPQDRRRIHTQPIPRLGGIAIFLSVAVALLVLPLLDNLVTQSLVTRWRVICAVLIPSTLVLLFGIFDDLHGTSAKWKFTALGLAAVLFYFMGGRISAITLPFIGSTEIPAILSLMLTVLWIVSISNAFNLIDGMDGLAAGASLFAALVMLVVSFTMGNPFVTVILLALSGALIGFLRYNFNPASIFLGDSGALFIGFTLGALSIVGAQKASTAVAVAIPLMAFGLPVIDTGFTIIRRFISGKPLFQGDREHIHHKLLDRGWSQRRVAFVLYGVCALFGLIALLFFRNGGEGRMTGLLLMIVGVAIVLLAGRLRYHEVDEVKASMRRNFAERRIRAANHVHVRRVSRLISEATTLNDLFTAVRQMLEPGEFVYATLQLGRGGDAEGNQRIFECEKENRSLQGAEMRNGLIWWQWERGDIESREIVGSNLFWTLRLPLSTDRAGWGYINFYRELGGDGLLLDVNYLSDLFQREMALAVERIFEQNKSRARKSLFRISAAR